MSSVLNPNGADQEMSKEEAAAGSVNGQVVGADAGSLNPFDPARLRVSQDFEKTVGVKKLLTVVPVRKPSKEVFFRVHPGEDFCLTTAVIELKEDQEFFIIDPALREQLSAEPTFGLRRLVTVINRQGDVSIWPLRLPSAEGKIDSWSESALEAVERAKDRWIRMASNRGIGAYDVYEATGDLPPPVWPDLPFRTLLETAFKGRLIDSLDHPVIKRLRGEL
ncbi:MAG: hypothetical protein HYX69_10600 [Planctomycetia bacterium]|nr:hypothetical protein [Planctomycetia bacterium]